MGKGAFINHVDMVGKGGGCQMSILLQKTYLVKWSKISKNLYTWFMNDLYLFNFFLQFFKSG